MRRLFVVGQVFRFLKLHVLVLLLAALLTACGDDSGDSGGGSSSGTGSWSAVSTTSAPSARYGHTAVWTGSEMIVWGGTPDSTTVVNTGSRYNPSTDSWTATTTTSAPTARGVHTAVWNATGTEMIVWGGCTNISCTTPLDTGGRYNPSTDSWTAATTTNTPTARGYHTAVWTGSIMIICGGWGGGSTYFTCETGHYTPSTDTWAAGAIANAPTARYVHTAVWSGTEMIVFGGNNGTNYLNTGGRYNPTANSWSATTTTGAPTARYYHTAVYNSTGTEMIVWGGYDGSNNVNSGGKYNPSTDSWSATSTTNAPSARSVHTAVWSGTEMIIWSGCSDINCSSYVNTGGRYNPSTDSWSATSTTDAPTARYTHTAVWTGTQMIVWGGKSSSSATLNTGGRYTP